MFECVKYREKNSAGHVHFHQVMGPDTCSLYWFNMDLSRRLDIKHIDKFDGTNYQQWKHGLLMELELVELLDIVEVFEI